MKINYEITEYLERLMFEMNTAKRELSMVRTLGCEKAIICRVCRKAKRAEIRFETAKEEFSAILMSCIPNMKTWKLDFKTQEVECETN